MDDLFQYLIYGIIIISFLSSFFKKKGQPKQTPQPKVKQPDSISDQQKSNYPEPEIAAKKNDEYDILRELENMFKGNVKIPDQPKPRQADPYDIYQSSEIKDKDLDLVVDERMERSIEGNTQTNKRKSYDKAPSYKNAASLRKAKNIDSKIEIKAKEFERVLESTRKRKAAISEFNRKLKNPVNIKEYIIISEILGKPKAMRR